MNNKDSAAFREQYGRRLATQLCDQHFGARPTATLDGPAVLRFTPIRQVNLFVVQQLLAQWTQEMARLRSPYFDFEAEDVRQALTQFMNTLSRRIKLARPTFEPLLARAITDTLAIPLDPAATFEQKLLGGQPTATPEQLRDALRYLDTDKLFYQDFLDSLPAGTAQSQEALRKRFALYQEANYKHHQPLARLVEEFNALLPLTAEELQGAAPAEPVVAAVSTPDAPTPVVSSPPPAPEPVRPAEVPLPAPAVAAPKPAAPASAPVTQSRFVADAEPAAVPLYEKLKAGQPATAPLSEILRPERTAATLADQAPKVETLREAISINQRFSFINELFSGENMEYHAAIQHLDTLPDAETAKRYVTQDLAGTHDWSRKDEHVNKLLKLIDRKFA
ncbi:hypothetical protein [Hymenobacter psychrotolerans]|uniref:Uncharacterized protein n=1 Tax=Hymenobacter psychrotolerans DSM 18569 TaxID=1121959 RepID=A0A1M6YNT1_9BACT|nr:hypothetical protein [Hymenobacter psychrotolerans]SHL19984.1 hypothetical protein SAMN02746009_02326 [Hymenobacter psychrotolerans DSM 18569]